MILGHIPGISCNGVPVIWRQNDNNTYQCLFTIQISDHQNKLSGDDKKAVQKLIGQRFNMSVDMINKDTIFDAEMLENTASQFVPSFIDSSPTGSSATDKSLADSDTQDLHAPRSSISPYHFLNTKGKPLLLANIVTDPAIMRKTTCFNNDFIKSNQDNFDLVMSSFIFRGGQINSLLASTAMDWILRLRQQQSAHIETVFNSIISKACTDKLRLSQPLKQYLCDVIERYMDDHNNACEPTQYEYVGKNTFPTKAAFISALKNACMTYASNNALFFWFLTDGTINPEEMSDNTGIQQSLNFIRLYIQQNPDLLTQMQAENEELINLSMITGLLERIKKLLVLQTPLSPARPNDLENKLIASYLMNGIIEPASHVHNESEISIDFSVLRSLASLMNQLQPEYQSLTTGMLQAIPENNFTVYSCQQTIFLLINPYFKDEERAQSQARSIYDAILDQLLLIQSSSKDDAKAKSQVDHIYGNIIKQFGHSTADKTLTRISFGLNKMVDKDCYLTIEAYKNLQETLSFMLKNSPQEKHRRKNKPLFNADAVNEIATTFIKRLLELRAVRALSESETDQRDRITRASSSNSY